MLRSSGGFHSSHSLLLWALISRTDDAVICTWQYTTHTPTQHPSREITNVNVVLAFISRTDKCCDMHSTQPQTWMIKHTTLWFKQEAQLSQSDRTMRLVSSNLANYHATVLWRCWLGGRKGIRPVKNRVVGYWHGYLSGARCIWPSWCHCYLPSLAPVKSRLVLPFWYRLTQVVLEKRPLNGCSSCSSSAETTYTTSPDQTDGMKLEV